MVEGIIIMRFVDLLKFRVFRPQEPLRAVAIRPVLASCYLKLMMMTTDNDCSNVSCYVSLCQILLLI